MYCRYGERECHWVSQRVWSFSRDFEVTSDLLSCTCVDLVLGGLDTIADVLVIASLTASEQLLVPNVASAAARSIYHHDDEI